MATQGNKTPKITFRTNHSGTKRFWHWTNFTLISLQLITVFFAWVVFNTASTVGSLERVLHFTHTTLSAQQTRFMAHAVNDQIWTWHKYIGIGIGILLLYRIIIEFFQSSDKKIYNVVKKAFGIYKAEKENKGNALHFLYSKLSYLVFYLIITIQVMTGLGMMFGRSLHISRSVNEVLHGIHQTDLFIILAYVVAHIAGVIWTELRKDRGIVSDMINGGD